MSHHVSNFVCDFQASLDKLRTTARAEVAAKDRVPADDYYDRFRRTSAEDFNKKHVLCSAHVIGIADPVKYRKG